MCSLLRNNMGGGNKYVEHEFPFSIRVGLILVVIDVHKTQRQSISAAKASTFLFGFALAEHCVQLYTLDSYLYVHKAIEKEEEKNDVELKKSWEIMCAKVNSDWTWEYNISMMTRALAMAL
jgi:hypothetical protein